jgi:hypothetical protein
MNYFGQSYAGLTRVSIVFEKRWIAGSSPAMTMLLLMIIPRHADATGDVVVAGGKLHAGAGRLLPNG